MADKKVCVLCNQSIQVPENFRALNDKEKTYQAIQAAIRVYGESNCFIHNNCGRDLEGLAGRVQ